MSDFFAPAGRGVQHASLRAANRRAVLNTIAFNDGISNADVSRITGLAPQTASAIVSELEAEGFIKRGEVLRGRRGQPATPLSLNHQALYSIGCDIGWEQIQVTLIDLSSQEIARYRRSYQYPDATTIIAEAAKAIGQMVNCLTADQQKRLVGVGLSSSGYVHRWVDVLGAPPEQKATWANLDIRAEVEGATGLETMEINSGNAGCFAEMTVRPPPRPANSGYLFVDTTVSAGLVADHSLWEGTRRKAANLGGIVVCTLSQERIPAHAVASTMNLRRMVERAGHPKPGPDTTEWDWQSFGPALDEWLAEVANALAQISYTTTAIADVDQMVIDGVMPRHITERLVDQTRTNLAAMPEPSFQLPELSLGMLGPRAIAIGAAQLPVFRKYFSRDFKDMGL